MKPALRLMPPPLIHYRRNNDAMHGDGMVMATAVSEEGALPSEELLTAMGKLNQELVQAGVMLAGEGGGFKLHAQHDR